MRNALSPIARTTEEQQEQEPQQYPFVFEPQKCNPFSGGNNRKRAWESWGQSQQTKGQRRIDGAQKL